MEALGVMIRRLLWPAATGLCLLIVAGLLALTSVAPDGVGSLSDLAILGWDLLIVAGYISFLLVSLTALRFARR
jgi:hypothetical protein